MFFRGTGRVSWLKSDVTKVMLSLLASVLALAVFAVAADGSTRGAAVQKLTLRLASDSPLGSEGVDSDTYLASEVSRLSRGKVKINIYPSSELGTEQATVTAVRSGAIDMFDLPPAEIAGDFPKIALFDAPFLMESDAGAKALFNSSIGVTLLGSMTKSGVIGLGWMSDGSDDILTKTPVTTPSNLRGLTIRATTDSTVTSLLAAWGAVPSPLAATDVYSALEQNVVQGAWGTVGGFYGLKWDEQASYFDPIHAGWDVEVIGISPRTWKKMNLATRTVITKAMTLAEKYNIKSDEQVYTSALAKMRQVGVKVTSPDRAAFATADTKIKKSLASTLGPDVNKAYALEKKYDAG